MDALEKCVSLSDMLQRKSQGLSFSLTISTSPTRCGSKYLHHQVSDTTNEKRLHLLIRVERVVWPSLALSRCTLRRHPVQLLLLEAMGQNLSREPDS